MRKWISLLLLVPAFCVFAEEEATDSEVAMTDGGFGKGAIKNTLTARMERIEGRVADIEQKNVNDKYAGKSLITRCCEDEDSFAIYGDFLWWRAQNDGFKYALDLYAERSTNVVSMPYDWDPGFRLGLGYNTSYDGWDIYALWTYFHNKSTHSLSNYDYSDESDMFPIYFPSVAIGFTFIPAGVDVGIPSIGYCKASWDIDYDTVELLFDRDFFIGKSLALKPFFAAKALFLKQKFLMHYADPDPTDLDYLVFFPLDVRLQSKYWGVGPKVGLDTSWYLLKQLKLYANVAADLVYGERKEYINATSPEENLQLEGRNKMDVLTPTLNMAVGAAFTYCFDESTSLDLHVAWETLYIWNQYISQAFTQIYTYHNLNEPLHMQGLTAGAEIRF